MCLLVSFNSFPFYSFLSFIIIQPLFFGISLNIEMDSAVLLFVYYCVSVRSLGDLSVRSSKVVKESWLKRE